MPLLHHNQLDNFTVQWLTNHLDSGKPIYCGSGCAGCCHLAVHSTFPEAVAIAKDLTDEQTIKLSAYIERLRQQLKEINELKDYLRRHRSEIGPCPFLDSHDCCSIYSSRPLSCRALLSTRPAEWCRVDFSELDHWDKQAFESSLDRKAVAWPTHYVAATQDYAREMENHLMVEMRQQKGWSLSGNFAVMTWLEVNCHLDEANLTREQVQQVLTENRLDNNLILRIF